MIIQAAFQTIRPAGTYSINVIAESGRTAYGVLCDNAGHQDWTLFDSIDDAKLYNMLLEDA